MFSKKSKVKAADKKNIMENIELQDIDNSQAEIASKLI